MVQSAGKEIRGLYEFEPLDSFDELNQISTSSAPKAKPEAVFRVLREQVHYERLGQAPRTGPSPDCIPALLQVPNKLMDDQGRLKIQFAEQVNYPFLGILHVLTFF